MSNPNGANQYLLDPRQNKCWELYTNPKSETFSNAYRSAILAGYEEDSAKQITVTNWFLERTRRMNMLNKAEKVLDETLEMDTKDFETGKVDSSLQKTKADVAKFIASTVGKNVYSTRSELTGQNGESLVINVVNYGENKPEANTDTA